jgi:glutamate/tyrosine decarboxylase-like PLP-dependent enzyme
MLELDRETRRALWERVLARAEEQASALREGPVAPQGDAVRALVEAISAHDFSRPVAVPELVELVLRGLSEGQVQVAHPRYFGTFNPAPADVAVIAQALVAARNPQLATRGHAPWPVAVEERVLRAIAGRFGFAEEQAEGTFTSGGAEANTTALLVALSRAFPEARTRGLRALPGAPTLYVSAEGHPTVARAARIAGLGSDAVRTLPVGADLRMKAGALREAIARDRAAGALPFLLVGTCGTTASGALDPLDELATIAERERLWLHVDAAWGGLAAFVPELAGAVHGLARADSITFDPHKALSVPMGTGAYLSRHRGKLAETFEARAGYMPRGEGEPFAQGMAWSRRFAGLAVFLVLASEGWDGVAESLRGQLRMAERLRGALRAEGWRILAESALPIVLFVDGAREDGDRPAFLEAVARRVIAEGAGWISVVRLSNGGRALRACVDNHRTREEDVDRLLDALREARG